MKPKVIVSVLASALSLCACATLTSPDAKEKTQMLSAANAWASRWPICAVSPQDTSRPWERALIAAGLVSRIPSGNLVANHRLRSSLLWINGEAHICVGHADADNIITVEPIKSWMAENLGISPETKMVTFHSHLVFASWATSRRLRATIMKQMIGTEMEGLAPNMRLLLYRDSKKRWNAIGEFTAPLRINSR
jgi:hypothetical protein